MFEKIINTIKTIAEENYNRYMHPNRFGDIGAAYTPEEMKHLVDNISIAMSEIAPNQCGIEILGQFAEQMEKLQNTSDAQLKNSDLDFIDVGMNVICSILPLNEEEENAFLANPVILGEQYSLREYAITRAKYCSVNF